MTDKMGFIIRLRRVVY